MSDLLEGKDVESMFWKAAATLWPEIRMGVIAEWIEKRSTVSTKLDLPSPDLDVNEDFPQACIGTAGGHTRLVITAMLPLDDGWHLAEAWRHYDDHECEEAFQVVYQWLTCIMTPLLTYWKHFTPPEDSIEHDDEED